MNIFDYYLEKIKLLLNDLNKEGQIILPSSLEGINAEIPPEKFDCDISTNVAMVLSKINNKPPFDLAERLSKKIKSLDEYIDNVSIAKPGFINIKLKPSFWTNFINNIIKIPDTFGVNEKEDKNKVPLTWSENNTIESMKLKPNLMDIPNSNRIIFSSNLHDPKGRDFDLYAINVDGTGLERITYFNGFDGFPMFSPDGRYLVFASNRNQIKRGDTNLFIAEWNYK